MLHFTSPSVSTEDIHLLQQATSAHLGSICPSQWSHDTALWHLLTCHCCRGNLYREADLFPVLVLSLWDPRQLCTTNMRAPHPVNHPKHISSCLNRGHDDAHPPAPVCCCLGGAEMAQLWTCRPSYALPGSCPIPSLPHFVTSAMAPGSGNPDPPV